MRLHHQLLTSLQRVCHRIEEGRGRERDKEGGKRLGRKGEWEREEGRKVNE